MKNIYKVLASAMLMCAVMTPALSISVSYSSGNGGESISSSARYSLDDSTSLQEQSVLLDGRISQTREAVGKGSNYIDYTVSRNGFSSNSLMISKGTFATSASASVSEGGADLTQRVDGSGDLEASVQGTVGSSAASQGASVNDGKMATTQSLASSHNIFSQQNTALKGRAGSIASASSSLENDISVEGGFSGDGDLQVDMNSEAAERSTLGGDAYFMGMPVLGNDDIRVVAADMAMSVEGLYEQSKGGIGTFGLTAINSKKDKIGSETSSLLTGPSITADGGSSSAYVLLGKRLNKKDPQVKLYLKDDAKLRNEGLNPTAVANTISAAANTWDDATNQNLFADTNLVTIDSTVTGNRYDGKNVHSWKPFTSTCMGIAVAQTFYNYNKVDGYYSILECDINYNTNYNWATSGNAKDGVDVQSVALHELGHSIGLGDLYGKSRFSKDTSQVMHYYTGIKRTLGNGDKTGAWLLYH